METCVFVYSNSPWTLREHVRVPLWSHVRALLVHVKIWFTMRDSCYRFICTSVVTCAHMVRWYHVVYVYFSACHRKVSTWRSTSDYCRSWVRVPKNWLCYFSIFGNVRERTWTNLWAKIWKFWIPVHGYEEFLLAIYVSGGAYVTHARASAESAAAGVEIHVVQHAAVGAVTYRVSNLATVPRVKAVILNDDVRFVHNKPVENSFKKN